MTSVSIQNAQLMHNAVGDDTEATSASGALRLVGTNKDLADLFGVKPSVISNWRSRYPDFPAPFDPAGRQPRYDLDHVVAWARLDDNPAHVPPNAAWWWRRTVAAFGAKLAPLP